MSKEFKRQFQFLSAGAHFIVQSRRDRFKKEFIKLEHTYVLVEVADDGIEIRREFNAVAVTGSSLLSIKYDAEVVVVHDPRH